VWLTEFPDGTVYKIPVEYSVAGLKDRVRDLGFVLDTLQTMHQSDAILTGGLDLTRVAAMGWSYGTETAGGFCRLDDRCKAAISLDWGFGVDSTAPDLFAAGLQKPSLMLNASNNTSDILFRKAVTDAYWIQIGNTVHEEFSTYGWWIKPNSLPATREVARTIHAYVLSFLNKYLKGQDDHLLLHARQRQRCAFWPDFDSRHACRLRIVLHALADPSSQKLVVWFAGLHQRAANAFSLFSGFHADRGQIPVRLRGVSMV
jgi:hypothetical protein